MEWVQKNLVSIIIAIVGVVVQFNIYGYRIDALEKRQDKSEAAIQSQSASFVVLQVQVAQMSTDVSYIKQAVDRLNK